MARKPKDYDNEILNIRAFYLKVFGKLWVVILSVILGAIVAGAAYTAVSMVNLKNARYQVDSTLYIYFAYNENSGTEVDYYNAYTWNTLVKTDDAILEPILKDLRNKGYDVDRSIVEEAVSADIPSDVRVMILSVSHKDKDFALALAESANEALINYGKTNDAFEQIKLLGMGEASMQAVTDRLPVACIFGGSLGLVLSVIALVLLSLMNDEVYVPEDVERRYHMPVLGVLTSEKRQEPSFFRNELITLMGEKIQELDAVAVISADDKKGKTFAENGISRLHSVLGTAFDFNKTKFIPISLFEDVDNNAQVLSNVRCAIILTDMGKKNAPMTEHIISLLHKLECPVGGIIITSADDKFLKRYMGF